MPSCRTPNASTVHTVPNDKRTRRELSLRCATETGAALVRLLYSYSYCTRRIASSRGYTVLYCTVQRSEVYSTVV